MNTITDHRFHQVRKAMAEKHFDHAAASLHERWGGYTDEERQGLVRRWCK